MLAGVLGAICSAGTSRQGRHLQVGLERQLANMDSPQHLEVVQQEQAVQGVFLVLSCTCVLRQPPDGSRLSGQQLGPAGP